MIQHEVTVHPGADRLPREGQRAWEIAAVALDEVPVEPDMAEMIVAVALQDGAWHHVRSYLPERASRPDTVALWHKIRTVEDPRWTERYHADDPAVKAFGGRITIRMKDGSLIADERAVANAHSLGRTPWERPDYIRKFRTLTEGVLDGAEAERFLGLVQRLPALTASELLGLHVTLPPGTLAATLAHGIF